MKLNIAPRGKSSLLDKRTQAERKILKLISKTRSKGWHNNKYAADFFLVRLIYTFLGVTDQPVEQGGFYDVVNRMFYDKVLPIYDKYTKDDLELHAALSALAMHLVGQYAFQFAYQLDQRELSSNSKKK